MKNPLRNSLAGLAIATTAITTPGCDPKIDATQVATEAGVKKLLQESTHLSDDVSDALHHGDYAGLNAEERRLKRIAVAIATSTKKPAKHFLPWEAWTGAWPHFYQGNDINGTRLSVYFDCTSMKVKAVGYVLNTGLTSDSQTVRDLEEHMTKAYSGKTITSSLLDEMSKDSREYTPIKPAEMTVSFPTKMVVR